MTFPYLPQAPDTSDPGSFRERADAFFSALGSWTEGLVELGNAASAGFVGTSSTQVTVPGQNGSTVQLVTQSGKGFVAGQTVMVASTANPSGVWIQGKVRDYTAWSGALNLDVEWVSGAGQSASSWVISISAPVPNFGVLGTSTTALAVSATGVSFSLMASTRRAWRVGDALLLDGSTTRMIVRVTSYNIASGEMTAICLWLQGNGTASSWTIGPSIDPSQVNLWTAIDSQGTATLDLTKAQHFVRQVSANTTLAFSGAPSGQSFGFSLRLVFGMAAYAVTWPSSVKWPSDTAPMLVAAKTHVFVFVTDDGGNTWRGISIRNYAS